MNECTSPLSPVPAGHMPWTHLHTQAERTQHLAAPTRPELPGPQWNTLRLRGAGQGSLGGEGVGRRAGQRVGAGHARVGRAVTAAQ